MQTFPGAKELSSIAACFQRPLCFCLFSQNFHIRTQRKKAQKKGPLYNEMIHSRLVRIWNDQVTACQIAAEERVREQFC